MLNRRQASKLVLAAAIGQTVGAFGNIGLAESAEEILLKEMRRLEQASGGRLGVAVIETGTGNRFSYRGDERFPMCSTMKMLLAAAVLRRVDEGKEHLSRRVRVSASDIVSHSPVTKPRVGDEIALAELCEGTMTLSDNAAANLLLVDVGGPAGVTQFVRSLGDSITRLDRNEPDLNEARPGDPRDTTTPNAMASNLQSLVLGNALSPTSRNQLAAWMIANKTGDTRIRAGLPAGWRVGDKTGSCRSHTANDIAVIWPPGRAPVVVTAYLNDATVPSAEQNATLASLAKLVAAAV
jgi:beta-lactamase class A